MPTILMLNDTADQDNWGSQACADSFRAILRKTNPSAAIRTIPSFWMFRQYHVTRVFPFSDKVYAHSAWEPQRFIMKFGRFFKPLRFLPRNADEYGEVAKAWLGGDGGPAAKEYLDYLAGADVVVLNGEGSTYRNNFTAIKALFMLWFAKTQLKKPSFFLNGSVTVSDVDPILPAMINKTFQVLDGITIREPVSYANLKASYPHLSAKIVPDSAFTLSERPATSMPGRLRTFLQELGDKPYFCFTPSWLPMDYESHPQQSSLHYLLTHLVSDGSMGVIVAKDQIDQFTRKIAQNLGLPFFGPENDYQDLMALLKHAQFLISGRYHNVIIASLVGCPSIPLTTTSHKMEGLCKLLNGEICTPYDATDLWSHMDSILAEAKRLTQIGPERREQLRATAHELGQQALEMGHIVSPFLGEATRTREKSA